MSTSTILAPEWSCEIVDGKAGTPEAERVFELVRTVHEAAYADWCVELGVEL